MKDDIINCILAGIIGFCFAMVLFSGEACAELIDPADCVSDAEPGRAGSCIIKPYEISNVLLTIFWFDTEQEMHDYYVDAGFGNPDKFMRSFSASEIYEEKNMCHLDLFAVRPILVDDDPTLSIGHEVVHCVYGPDYHEVW